MERELEVPNSMSSSLLQLVYRLSSELLLITLGEDSGEGEDWLLGPASGGEDTLAMAAAKANSQHIKPKRNSCIAWYPEYRS